MKNINKVKCTVQNFNVGYTKYNDIKVAKIFQL